MSEFAASFCARHQHLAGFIDRNETNVHAELLRANGLEALNVKVLESASGEVLDLIAEHNMAAMLVGRGFTGLEHEPRSMSKPVDLVGMRDGRTYRIEMKRLAASEHDELHSRTMQALNTALKLDTQSIMIEMSLHESFEAADINALVRHVKQTLREPRVDEVYTFAVDDEIVASYRLRSASRGHPYVGILGDYLGEMRDVTGVDASRVRGKVRKAYAKFKVCPNAAAVHLVVLEVDNTIDLVHVAEALYGPIYVEFTRQGPVGRGRHPGGVFTRGLHSRLGGLVVARRKEGRRLLCGYNFTLFRNPGGTLPVSDVVEALGVERILGPTDFP